ncbi:DUF4328 domain-containing protein [Brevibacillus fluminis]|uniref:DUF4328 domain-containing protein n=1 Tax=Brevibacillus fluminis TaxID=511487 RepID=UPI003F89AF50
MKLKSERTGKFLYLLLIVGLICSCISLICSTVHAWNEDVYYDSIEWFDTALALFNIAISLLSIVFFLVWIYRFHADLFQLDATYPISSGGALARIIIPFYNIVGLWTVYSTLANYWINQSEQTRAYGRQLKWFIPFYYFGQMVNNGLNRIMMRSDTPSLTLELWTIGTEVFVSIMYVGMFMAMTKGLRESLAKKESKGDTMEG